MDGGGQADTTGPCTPEKQRTPCDVTQTRAVRQLHRTLAWVRNSLRDFATGAVRKLIAAHSRMSAAANHARNAQRVGRHPEVARVLLTRRSPM
jgi:hypothetical protein